MPLATHDELGNRIPMSDCTPILLATYDVYQFLDCFLAPVLLDFGIIPKEPLAHFSQIQIYWMSNECSRYDWFLGKDFSFIQVHGFFEEPFCLPTYVTDRTLALEISWKLVEVEKSIGLGK